MFSPQIPAVFLLPFPPAWGPMAGLPWIGQQWERWLPCSGLQLVESVRCDRHPTSILRWICSILDITWSVVSVNLVVFSRLDGHPTCVASTFVCMTFIV